MIARILDWLWPRVCEVCGGVVDRPDRHVCSDCLMRLPFVPSEGCCRICGRAVAGFSRDYVCEDCSGRLAPRFDRAASALRFEAEARTMILAYKFRRHLWLVSDFADWLEASVRVRFEVEAVDAVVAMPSTLAHRIDRGYNPCVPLATALARRIDRRFIRCALRRCGHPARQGGLDEAARRSNVRGTFRVLRPELVRGRTLLVVDDIMTTGSTLSECAGALKAAGASRVWTVTLARSIRV